MRLQTNELQKFTETMDTAIEQFEAEVDTEYVSDVLKEFDWYDFDVTKVYQPEVKVNNDGEMLMVVDFDVTDNINEMDVTYNLFFDTNEQKWWGFF